MSKANSLTRVMAGTTLGALGTFFTTKALLLTPERTAIALSIYAIIAGIYIRSSHNHAEEKPKSHVEALDRNAVNSFADRIEGERARNSCAFPELF